MANEKRWFWIGSREAVRDAIAAVLGAPPAAATAANAAAGDVVVFDALADAAACAGLGAGHVFAAVRAAKEQKGVAVFVVVAADDAVGTQLARFVLADGVLSWDGHRLDARELLQAHAAPRRVPVDALLAKLEPKLAAAGGESSLQRLLRFEREDTLLQRLQDPETGLFDGPYAALKLEEEWKRAHRFHQPLSLLLVDLGADLVRASDPDRRLVLAEAAGVFLNECRDIDVLARFAPSVFLFLLPGTGPDGAEVLAKRMLEALGQRFAGRADVRPAGGLCTVPSSEVPDRRAFLAIAEACLARARAAGAGVVSATWQ
jgi:GGDEF domain-containing protein